MPGVRGWEEAGLHAQPAAAGSGWGSGPLCRHVLPQGTAASTKNKLPSLITSMETVGAKALEDFADNIKVLPPPLLPAAGEATPWAGPLVTCLGNSFGEQASKRGGSAL